MPLFAIYARDKPDHLETRLATREKHVAHLNGLGDRLRLAGPWMDEGGRPAGSLVVIEAGSEQEARLFADADPYAHAGLFESVDVVPFDARLGLWAAQPDARDEAGDEEE